MLSKRFINDIFIVILWCSTGNAILSSKASIVTPVGETTNYQQWSIPFYDNNFGILTTSVPIPLQLVTTPQPVPVISIAPPPPATTIGRTNSISISQAVFPGGSNPVDIAPPISLPTPTVSITNPILMINYTGVPIVTSNSAPKIISNIELIIDPNNMINYSLPVLTIPTTEITNNNVPPASTVFPPIIIDPSNMITHPSTAPSTTIISTSQSTITTTPSSTSSPITTQTPTTDNTSTTTTAIFAPNTSTTSLAGSIVAATSPIPTTAPPSSTSVTEITESPSPICDSTSQYRPLGPDCGYKSTDLSNQVTIINTGSTLNTFQMEVPAVIRFDVNITSVPNYIVSVSPVTQGDSDVVEIVSASSSRLVTPVGTSSNLNSVNIDLSDPRLDLGWSSSVLPTFATSLPAQNRVSENKCIEYYSTGRRATRASTVQVFIINGQTSNQKEFPHMAALGYGAKTDNQWLCGGSLISENYVITAGHCLSAKSLGPVQFVRLGTTTLQTETLDSADYNVIRRIPFPTYVEGRQYDDIALLQLERPVEFSEYIAPICLYTSTVLDGITLTATGWGRTTPTGSTAKELKKVDLDVIPFDVCQNAYSVVPKEELPYGILRDSHICAGNADGSKDTCQGDSGGPLSMVQDGRIYLVGITSFGIGCAQPGVPGVYTRVSNYLPWIEQTIWGR